MKKGIRYCILLSIISSCNHGLKPADYIQYVQDKKNGLKKVVEVDGWQYTMQYKPHEFILLMEGKGKISSAEMQKRRQDMKGTVWFNISFRRSDGAVTSLRYGIASMEEYN